MIQDEFGMPTVAVVHPYLAGSTTDDDFRPLFQEPSLTWNLPDRRFVWLVDIICSNAQAGIEPDERKARAMVDQQLIPRRLCPQALPGEYHQVDG
jgi:hypothetical protein